MLVSALQLARNRAYGGSRARCKITPLAYNRLNGIESTVWGKKSCPLYGGFLYCVLNTESPLLDRGSTV